MKAVEKESMFLKKQWTSVRLTRSYIHREGTVYQRRRNGRAWKDEPMKPTLVCIIGIRTLANGYIESNYDEPTSFIPESYIKAYLVVSNLYSKPFYIPYYESSIPISIPESL